MLQACILNLVGGGGREKRLLCEEQWLSLGKTNKLREETGDEKVCNNVCADVSGLSTFSRL